MRRVRARVLFGVMLVAASALICVYILNPERRIFSMVEKNQATYKEVAVELLAADCNMEVEELYSARLLEGEHIMVDFPVTGVGIAPSSISYGFYYSPDDVPLAFPNADVALTQYERDSWEWSANGDNRGITKKIAECWYYYEVSF